MKGAASGPSAPPVGGVVLRGPVVVLVEGNSDKDFLDSIAQGMGLTGVEVWPYGGKGSLRGYVKGVRANAGFGTVKALGVTRDADTDPQAAWDAIRGAIRDAGLAEPTRQNEVANGTPAVVGMVMPPDGLGGLEDYFLRPMAGTDLMNAADEYLTKVGTFTGAAPWLQDAKHRYQAWSAGHPDIAAHPGLAMKKGYSDWSAAAYEEARRFLTALASVP